MSETPIGSDEFPETGADDLTLTLILLTGCIGEALTDMCSYSLTIGETYVPFNPDEDEEDSAACEENPCSQMWVRVSSIQPRTVDSFGGDGCSMTLRLDLEVGVVRCFPIMEEGEAPTATQVLEAHAQSMQDMSAVMCAALSCEAIEDRADGLEIGTWSPMGPTGGEYGGIWTFTLEI